jgi:hypothetical protein
MKLCDNAVIEKVHIKFCKYLLGVNRKISNVAVKAELGRNALLINLLNHSTKYWHRVCRQSPETLSHKSYIGASIDVNSTSYNWAALIKHLFDTFSLPAIWEMQGNQSKNKISELTKDMSKKYNVACLDLINRPATNATDTNKLRTYKLFKKTFGVENYVLMINATKRKFFTQLRISAHCLRIESGRHTVPHKLPAHLRICQFCNLNEVEDECHLMLHCHNYNSERETLFRDLSQFTDLTNRTDLEKLIFLMSYNNGDVGVLNHVIKYVNSCMEKRSNTT